jgi:putative FmdB family regulatory protein
MPIYEYECDKCGCFEHTQSIHDAPLSRCPTCRRKVQRLISRAAFHLKGGGWYADGYSGTGKQSKTESEAAPSDAGDGSAPASDKASEKSAPKKPKKAKADTPATT